MHIRRLGILLTEIALGHTIQDVVYNVKRNDIEFDLDLNVAMPELTPIFRIREILSLVRSQASEDYGDAVAYCLNQGTPAERITEEDIVSFYDYVVTP